MDRFGITAEKAAALNAAAQNVAAENAGAPAARAKAKVGRKANAKPVGSPSSISQPPVSPSSPAENDGIGNPAPVDVSYNRGAYGIKRIGYAGALMIATGFPNHAMRAYAR